MNWTGKKVLVTGAGGFIGSHLTERLVSLGANVRAMVRYNSRNSRGWLEDSRFAGEMEFAPGDVRDSAFVEKAVAGTDVVFHLAALIGIPYSYEAPYSYVDVNVTGTLNIVQAALRTGSTKVIQTSTSEVYGTAREIPISELHPLQAQSPYAATKIAADKLVESFIASFDLPAVVVRPFNTFGPRQSERAVIPAIVAQLLRGATVLRLGNTSPTRDLNFVSNTVDGFVAAAESDAALGRTVHFGSGREISIGDLALLISRLCGVHVEIASDESRTRPVGSEVERLIADDTLARRLLRWSPKVTLEEGLTEVIAWMRANPHLHRGTEYVR